MEEGQRGGGGGGRSSRQTESYISTSRIREASNGASDVLVPRARQRWPTPKSSPIHSLPPPPLPLEIVETCKPKVPHVARKFRCEASFSSLFSSASTGTGTNRNYKYLVVPSSSPLFLTLFRSLPTVTSSLVLRT